MYGNIDSGTQCIGLPITAVPVETTACQRERRFHCLLARAQPMPQVQLIAWLTRRSGALWQCLEKLPAVALLRLPCERWLGSEASLNSPSSGAPIEIEVRPQIC
jgi:hypothetical protein